MIATALAIQDATKEAVMDSKSVALAYEIWSGKDSMSEMEFANAMFSYSAHLSSLTTALVLRVALTESQLDEMIDTIKEMQSMGEDITNE